MTRKKTRKGAIITTTTEVRLEPEVLTTDFGLTRSRPVPLSAINAFVTAVHEQVGEGAEELGDVKISGSGLTYTISDTLREGLK